MAEEHSAPTAVVAVLSVILGIAIGAVGTYLVVSSRAYPGPSNDNDSVDTPTIACTEIGAQGGITIVLPASEATPGSKARLSVDNGSGSVLSAEITTSPTDSGEDYITLPIDYGSDDTLSIALTYTNTQGQENTLQTQGRPVLVEPNGPQCPPHVYQLNLALTGGALVPQSDS